MKTELKAKFLQHISQKKRDGGFTLIELLVVIIIIGILSAIALPSFLNQANKARQSEARTYVGSMNRAQQARFMEAGKFAGDGQVADLGLGIRTQTEHYEYTLETDGEGSLSAVSRAIAGAAAPLVDFAGVVWVGTTDGTDTGEKTTRAILCEAENTTTPATDVGLGVPANESCPANWRTL
ncbi:PHA accumulation regulator DNA-binding-like protein [Limnospira maxima CS-328]|uniref:PHA accumulation regulator DNA-binding-like protein n=1 Tax=Limnospira maxima CS-328 TaxID=513049 RepID=B5W796_LIMMA|nr:type IV pilin-like G/H family protein [Limnospira maxima]EDZ92583.1 PHA accumulation regulator DNA-binding-like protein [Limnospira maxima CS-328]MDC0836338.1 type IV pilin-like G/H family protein [Limnoraphis robusta]